MDLPANRLGIPQWVLSRALCRFRRFDLGSIPGARRSKALQLQIRQWSPFVRSGQYVVWGEGYALVWAWDADLLTADLAGQKLKPDSTRIIPESLLHPVQIEGFRLVACLDGAEGQLWQTEQIVHSRWWPQQPTLIEWQNFQRDAGIAPAQGGVPEPRALSWQDRPWAKAAKLSHDESRLLAHEAWLIGMAVVLLAGFTSWHGIELIKTRHAVAQLKTELAAAEQSARPLLEDRARAMDALARIESLLALNPYPPQATLMAEVAKQLPVDGAYLKEWDYQNGRLKTTIVLPNKFSSSVLVKKFQDAGLFRNVQAMPSADPQTLMLSMEALLQSEIQLQTKDESETSMAQAEGKT